MECLWAVGPEDCWTFLAKKWEETMSEFAHKWKLLTSNDFTRQSNVTVFTVTAVESRRIVLEAVSYMGSKA